MVCIYIYTSKRSLVSLCVEFEVLRIGPKGRFEVWQGLTRAVASARLVGHFVGQVRLGERSASLKGLLAIEDGHI